MIKTVGSVCSGIEAASIAWKPLGLAFSWFSEIATFPSKVLSDRFPEIVNLGDMNKLPLQLMNEEIDTPDLICGGTPCQAFSLAGLKCGLCDNRGNLTLKFIDIIDANDSLREKKGLQPSVIFWENVEGVLKDKTNAFGSLVSYLVGLSEALDVKIWPTAGVLRGPKRNVAWRVLDAKYFGVPQQRRRVYVIAGGKDFFPENVLFENHKNQLQEYPKTSSMATKNGQTIEVFRAYSDCLYAAYGTKWNGNAAAYNGSLFVVQNGRLRRLSPVECERLMGIPDNYTNIKGSTRTNRYQAIGNSWAVPVVRWIGERLLLKHADSSSIISHGANDGGEYAQSAKGVDFLSLPQRFIPLENGQIVNCSEMPEECTFQTLLDIVTTDVPEELYISPVGCQGMIRRKRERHLTMNQRLEEVLLHIASQMPEDEIEMRSRIQPRGKLSRAI